MYKPRTVEQLLDYWCNPGSGEAKSLRSVLLEAYERGREDQEADDYAEMDNKADDLITKVDEVLGKFRARRGGDK